MYKTADIYIYIKLDNNDFSQINEDAERYITDTKFQLYEREEV